MYFTMVQIFVCLEWVPVDELYLPLRKSARGGYIILNERTMEIKLMYIFVHIRGFHRLCCLLQGIVTDICA